MTVKPAFSNASGKNPVTQVPVGESRRCSSGPLVEHGVFDLIDAQAIIVRERLQVFTGVHTVHQSGSGNAGSSYRWTTK